MKKAVVIVAFCTLLIACSRSQYVSLIGPEAEQFPVQIRAIGNVSSAQTSGLFIATPLEEGEGVLYRFPVPVVINFFAAQNTQIFDLFFFTEQGLMAAGWNTTPCESQPCNIYTSRIPVTSALLLQPGYLQQSNMMGWSLQL